jgi:hypothetical protein
VVVGGWMIDHPNYLLLTKKKEKDEEVERTEKTN